MKIRQRVEVFAVNPERMSVLCYIGFDRLSGELPGGGVDEGEDFQTAGIRETMEESGYTLSKFVSRINIDSPAVFLDKDHTDEFIGKRGIDGEETIYLLFEVGEYKPDETYRTEGDARMFIEIPLEKISELALKYGKLECERVRTFVSRRPDVVDAIISHYGRQRNESFISW